MTDFKNGDIIKERPNKNGQIFTDGTSFTFDENMLDKDGYIFVIGKGYVYVNNVNFELVSSANNSSLSDEVIENVVKYCEDKAIFDKLGNYGDFYYKLKNYLNNKK